MTHASAVLHVSLNEPSTVFWVLVELAVETEDVATPAPSASSILAAFTSDANRQTLNQTIVSTSPGARLVALGDVSFDTTHFEQQIARRTEIGPIKPTRVYDLFIVARDTADVKNAQSITTSLTFVAKQNPLPEYQDAQQFCLDEKHGGNSARKEKHEELLARETEAEEGGVLVADLSSERLELDALFAFCDGREKGDPRERAYTGGGEGEVVKGVRVGVNRNAM